MTIAQLSVGGQKTGRPGQIADAQLNQDELALNHVADSVKQVYTLDVSAASASDVCSVDIEGQVFSIVATGTAADDGAALKAAIDAHTFAGLAESIVDGGAGILTWTGKKAGYGISIEEVSNCTVTETTSPTFGSDLLSGIVVFYSDDGSQCQTALPTAGITDYSIAGITIEDMQNSNRALGNNTIKTTARQHARVLRTGTIYVEDGADAQRNGVVYVGGTGAELGRCFTAAGAGRVAIDRNRMSWRRANVVELTLGK